MQTEITYSHETGRHDLLVDGLYHSQYETKVEAEAAADEIRLAALKAMSPAMRLSLLALAYGKAVAENRLDDAKQIKQQAMELKAQQLGVTFDVFAGEYQGYRAEKVAA